jgi:peptidoglycan hydrolase-like protein with peptidoglycan-binding domain
MHRVRIKPMKGFILIAAISIAVFTGHTNAYAQNSSDLTTVDGAAASTAVVPEPVEPVKILIVPGHDDEHSGAVYGDYKEAYMNLVLASKIKETFTFDPLFDVTVARDWDGYTPELAEYFDENKRGIEFFIRTHKKKTERALLASDIDPAKGVTHNDAPALAAYRLYGINRWAGENEFDVVIHIHFNDEAGRKSGVPGKHSGYSIYIPSKELPNHVDSLELGKSIGARIMQSFPVSDLPLELGNSIGEGVIPDFKLIAVGANRTLDIPSVLVEYSYIYEPTVSPKFLDLTTTLMAQATSVGIREYISGTKNSERNLNYFWSSRVVENKEPRVEVLALQYGLSELGIYPSTDKTRYDCPLTGIFGPCTKQAVKDFQVSQGLKADGVVGAHTIGVLNYLFK